MYEPVSANPCDYGSRHPKMIPNINKLTELENENLGVEDDTEDSKFMVNRVVMEDDTKVLTIEKIAEATQEDPTLFLILKDVQSRKMSDSAKDTL